MTLTAKMLSNFWAKVDMSNECWLWMGARDEKGYGQFNAASAGLRSSEKAHRLAWRLRNGQIPSGLEVAHRCDVRSCVNPEHLWLATHKENMVDMARKGRQRVKVSPNQVAEIRLRRADGELTRVLAEEFGVRHSTISRIANRVRRKEAL